MANKLAVVVFSDPRSGTDEALGRVFNALFVTFARKQQGLETALIFQGAGVRWVGELQKPDHPAHGIYQSVKELAIACGGCADVFGAAHDITSAGLALVRERDIPGTSGVIDLNRYVADGYTLLTF